MTMAPISRDIAWFIVLLLLVPSTGVRRSLERNLARLGTRKRGRKFLIWRDKRSGPLPPALLTNAFANPLEVCAAGAIIMTPSHLLLQRTSLCCAKMPLSIGRRWGGNGIRPSIGSPRRLLGANLVRDNVRFRQFGQ